MTYRSNATSLPLRGGRRDIAKAILWPGAVGLAFLILLPLWAPNSLFDITIYAALSVLALSLALVWGYGGILCFGQAAFFGLGAYSYVISAINTGDMYLGVLLALIIPGLFAAALGWMMFYGRLSDVYVGIVTLVVTLILQRFLDQTAGDEYRIGEAFLGGFNGIPQFPILHWPGDPLAELSELEMFVLSVGLLILVYIGLRLFLLSHFGRVVVAVRENETRAGLLGYDTRLVKTLTFAIGGAIAGLAGCLFANANFFVDPKLFSLAQTAQILIWVLVGGLGTLLGPIVGVVLLEMLAKSLGEGDLGITLDPFLVTGAILMGFVLLVPRGIVPTLALVWRKRRTRSAAPSELARRGRIRARPPRGRSNGEASNGA